jgi:hypothetical protein
VLKPWLSKYGELNDDSLQKRIATSGNQISLRAVLDPQRIPGGPSSGIQRKTFEIEVDKE